MSGPCPSCRGRGYDVDKDDDFIACPDCAGTGEAENSITANERLRDAAPRLAEALKACADVLDGFAHDPKAEPYPCDCYSWTERDQEVLDEARAALREAGIES